MSKRKCKFSEKFYLKCRAFTNGRHDSVAKCYVCDSYVSVANKG